MTARFLLDASAYWRLMQSPRLAEDWSESIDAGDLAVCDATRTEILYSARNAEDRERMSEGLDVICEHVQVPKAAWQWVDTAQFELTAAGVHRSAGVVGLLLCATAVNRGLTVLHDDRDFIAVARVLPEVDQRRIHA